MVPLPVLDGGHVMLAMIEGIRRKPLNIRLLEVINTACAMLIILYMVYITFFDVQDLPFVRSTLDKLESHETPRAAPKP
jgi:regulator of sigma E protease